MTARRTVAALACAALLPLTSPAAASAAPAAPSPAAAPAAPRERDRPLAAALTGAASSRYLGGKLSGLVVDAASGATVWSHRAGTTRMPASTQKVLTAVTVFQSMNPDTELITRVLQRDDDPNVLYLRGVGDPSLTSYRLKFLAMRTAAKLRAQGRTVVTLYADDSAFPRPTNATGWKASYLTDRQVQPVRGLTLAGYRGPDGALAAANTLRAHLKTYGVTASPARRAVAPEQRTVLEQTWSAPVGALTASMLNSSNNDYAEYLLRVAAQAQGRYPTWSAALANQRAALARAGVPVGGLRTFDGSGLSRANRVAPVTLTGAVAALYRDSRSRSMLFRSGGMPVSGRSGTLRRRFTLPTQRCAIGRITAKTGTLNDVVALAGVARGIDGRARVFAFLENGDRRTGSVRTAIDQLATAATGCRR